MSDFGLNLENSFARLGEGFFTHLPAEKIVFTGDIIAGGKAADPLIHTLVQLGRSLGLRTVAEGIEDAEQLAHLRELGCDRGQGYLFAPPLEEHAFARLLERDAVLA